jgi:hypothetical protein
MASETLVPPKMSTAGQCGMRLEKKKGQYPKFRKDDPGVTIAGESPSMRKKPSFFDIADNVEQGKLDDATAGAGSLMH